MELREKISPLVPSHAPDMNNFHSTKNGMRKVVGICVCRKIPNCVKLLKTAGPKWRWDGRERGAPGDGDEIIPQRKVEVSAF